MGLDYLIISVFLSVFGIILHTFGVYCILKQKRSSNQKIILINLSIVEIFLMICYVIFKTVPYDKGFPTYALITIIFFSWFSLVLQFLMIYISIDRLLCSILHMQYRYYITSKVVKRVVVGIWIITAPMVVPYFIRNRCVKYICYDHLPILLNAIFVLLSLSAYSSIIYTVLKGK